MKPYVTFLFVPVTCVSFCYFVVRTPQKNGTELGFEFGLYRSQKYGFWAPRRGFSEQRRWWVSENDHAAWGLGQKVGRWDEKNQSFQTRASTLHDTRKRWWVVNWILSPTTTNFYFYYNLVQFMYLLMMTDD